MIQTLPLNWGLGDMISKNKLLACSTFPKVTIEKRVNRGLVMAEHRISIQELKVLFHGEGYAKDTLVYVRGDRVMQPWAKEVFTFEETEFILVPEAEIVFAKWNYNGPVYLNPQVTTTWTTTPGSTQSDKGDGGR